MKTSDTVCSEQYAVAVVQTACSHSGAGADYLTRSARSSLSERKSDCNDSLRGRIVANSPMKRRTMLLQGATGDDLSPLNKSSTFSPSYSVPSVNSVRDIFSVSSVPPRLRVGQSGFSLIEVAMAIVVISVGVLAMFGLMTAGLDASSKSVSETQSAQFAENVMNAMRSESLAQSKDNTVVTNELDNWQSYWKDFSNRKGQGIELPGWKAYSQSPIYITVTRPNETRSLALTNLSFRGGSPTNAVINLGLRYQLGVTLMNAPEGYDRHIPEKPSDFFTIVGVTLTVWDGLYGLPTLSDAMIFYSEFNNPGTL